MRTKVMSDPVSLHNLSVSVHASKAYASDKTCHELCVEIKDGDVVHRCIVGGVEGEVSELLDCIARAFSEVTGILHGYMKRGG
jgi:ABC-type phosphonate transport system ATPase subunit